MSRPLKIVFGISVTVLLVWILTAGTDWHAVFTALTQVKAGWLCLSLFFATGIHFARVQRWSYIIRASRPIDFRTIFSSAQIGFLFNVMLPLRLGEAIRMFVLSRLTKLRYSRCAILITLDRIADLAGLLAVLIVVLVSFPTELTVEISPGTFNNENAISVSSTVLATGAKGLTALLFVFLLACLGLYFNRDPILRAIDALLNPIAPRLGRRVKSIVVNLAEGMHVFRSPGAMLKSLGCSVAAWGCGTLSLACVLNAFGLEFPWNTPFMMLAMIAVFVVAPITPGLVGQYHIPVIACVIMMVPEATVPEAKAVALVAHLVSTSPIAIMGVFSLYLERKRLAGITKGVDVSSENAPPVQDCERTS